MANRYVLVDFQHLAYKTMGLPQLSASMMVDGVLQTIDTTIPNYSIKSVFNYSGKGEHFTAVCLEGGSRRRAEYFANQPGKGKSAYKEGRKKESGIFYQGIELATHLMHEGGVSCYRVQGVEADDCIASLVKQIRSVDKITPIDIITGDSDMLPLVDDQVSVYMRGKRQFSEEGCPSLKGYYQVTPDSWLDYLSYTSAYKDFHIPFNSMLLFKMIRGDKTDKVDPAVKGYGGVKYTNLMIEMEEDGIDFESIFRYDVDFDEVIRPILSLYFTKEQVDNMEYIFHGIKPEYLHLAIPKIPSLGELQLKLSPFKINLVRG